MRIGFIWCGVAALCVTSGYARGQETQRVERNVEVQVVRTGEGASAGQAVTWFGAGQGSTDFDIVTAPVSFDGPVVKNAPYSAEAVTEVTQTLADGNRIVRRNTAAIYRDGAGRTRRELGLTAIGPLVNSPDDVRHVSLNDPAQGVTFLLDPTTRTARKLTLPKLEPGPGGPLPMDGAMVFNAPLPAPAPGGPDQVFYRAMRTEQVGTPTTEKLGVQVIEGISAEGTKTTVTIPAGQIGNERSIDIVSERWYSPELKVLVMSRQSDPRFGETTYRLTGVVLGEPAAALFEVPADYKVVPAGGPALKVTRRVGEREQ